MCVYMCVLVCSSVRTTGKPHYLCIAEQLLGEKHKVVYARVKLLYSFYLLGAIMNSACVQYTYVLLENGVQ